MSQFTHYLSKIENSVDNSVATFDVSTVLAEIIEQALAGEYKLVTNLRDGRSMSETQTIVTDLRALGFDVRYKHDLRANLIGWDSDKSEFIKPDNMAGFVEAITYFHDEMFAIDIEDTIFNKDHFNEGLAEAIAEFALMVADEGSRSDFEDLDYIEYSLLDISQFDFAREFDVKAYTILQLMSQDVSYDEDEDELFLSFEANEPTVEDAIELDDEGEDNEDDILFTPAEDDEFVSFTPENADDIPFTPDEDADFKSLSDEQPDEDSDEGRCPHCGLFFCFHTRD